MGPGPKQKFTDMFAHSCKEGLLGLIATDDNFYLVDGKLRGYGDGFDDGDGKCM